MLMMLVSSCHTGNKSTPVAAPVAKENNSPTKPSESSKVSPPSREATFKYEIQWDYGSLVIGKDGLLTNDFRPVQEKIDRLTKESTKFDLHKSEELGTFGNYVGQELNMVQGQIISMTIKDIDTNRVLFSGELKATQDGKFEFARNNSKK
jgi:hypothetical protein